MPKPKAIRMEIDLNKPMPEEEELRRAKEEKNKAKGTLISIQFSSFQCLFRYGGRIIDFIFFLK